jgi:hypothetical protein
MRCPYPTVHVKHESVPFPTGWGGKLTLRCGHLLLKSSPPNSHQAFKTFYHQLPLDLVLSEVTEELFLIRIILAGARRSCQGIPPLRAKAAESLPRREP